MPVLLPLVVPFFAFIAAIILVGLSQTATSQQGSSGIKGFIDSAINNSILAQLFGLGKKAARAVVSHFAAAQLLMLARWLLSMGTLTLGWFTGNALFAEGVAGALERLEHRGDPRARAAAKSAGATAGKALTGARHADAHAGAVGKSLGSFKTRVEPQIKHATHAVDVTLPHAIGGIRTREDALSRDLGKLRDRTKSLEDGALDTWDWIRSHPLASVTGAFAGAVAIALTRLGYGFLRCSSWRNVGKRLTCGMGSWLGSLLDLIAGFGLAALSLEDPELLAEECVALVDTVEPILAEILSR